MRKAHLGIADMPAPEWDVPTWFNLAEGQSQLKLADLSEKVIYLYCFQAWCPGCHSHGFPTMAATRKTFADADVAFVAVQTVFEGHHVNTADRAIAAANEHGMGDLPVGHDPGVDGGPPDLMSKYRTGGTPWTVIIGPERRVCFDGFQIDPQTASAIVGQLLA